MMKGVSSTRLSDEARQTIRRVLEPSLGAAEVQRLIDDYEGTVPSPPTPAPSAYPQPGAVPTAADRAALWAPSPARSLEEAREQAGRVGGDVGSLILAVLGQSPLFTDDLPFESLLDRAYRNARPGPDLLPAVHVATAAPEPKNTGELLDLAEKMFASLRVNPDDPMQKGFAGLRLLMAVVKTMGKIRVVGLDQMSTPLLNLRDDAKSMNLGRLMVLEVERTFGEVRGYVDATTGNPVILPPSITERADTVTIGGVTLEVRKDR